VGADDGVIVDVYCFGVLVFDEVHYSLLGLGELYVLFSGSCYDSIYMNEEPVEVAPYVINRIELG